MKNALRNLIIKYCDNYRYWSLSRPLRGEKDPEKRFEIKLWLNISGAFSGSQGRDGAWETYKRSYYDKLSSDEEKRKIQTCLLSMLKSNRYSSSKKAFIAQVCADLFLEEALPVVNELLQETNAPRDIHELRLAHEALSRGITMYELIKERFLSGKRNEING